MGGGDWKIRGMERGREKEMGEEKAEQEGVGWASWEMKRRQQPAGQRIPLGA